ncbi:TspO/MBR family protein [Sediminicola luteus]|uniref:TspO protein n=1 Tax=Sediminicola luteus TaxID=319238 RepID=A0A2A4G9X5_9FLAO|nr:TspO/MBR family protein [Sediminicola luteus]PCE64786.1 hypothetical protein B7P33_06340 [Sediminicola luteus]
MKGNTWAWFALIFGLNFLALGLGVWLMDDGPTQSWYISLNKAPWTPPNWMFGFNWTLIMIFYAAFMVWAGKETADAKSPWISYALQWVLNVSWNVLFFRWELTHSGLVCILLLTAVITYQTLRFARPIGWRGLSIAPYLLWLLIATSLNAYICLYN